MAYKRFAGFDWWVLGSALLFLLTGALSGVLRYVLGTSDLAAIIYLPKILIAAALFFTFMGALGTGRLNKLYAGVLAGLTISFIVGFLYVPSLRQVLFGAWTLVPFLFGIVAYPAFQRHWRAIRPFLAVILLIAIVGVLLNALESFPWVGYTYELQNVVIEGSRQWTTVGIKRLAGFSRASYAAAAQILLLSSFVIIMSRGWFWRPLIWLATGAAVVLTTAKTVVVIYVLLTLFLVLRRFVPRIIWIAVAWLIAVGGIVIPLSTVVIHYAIYSDSFNSRLLFASFSDRLVNTWPQALRLVAEHGSIIFGRGLGGIGTPQTLFEPLLSNPADNLFVYLFALCGIGAIVFMAMYIIGIARLDLRRNRLDCFFYTVAIIVLLRGVTSNVLESAFMALFLGLSAGHVLTRWVARDAGAKPLSKPITAPNYISGGGA